jgi:DNA-binding transcriptional LysR family regulator
MSDRLSALRLFVRVARTRSFSAAGRELGLSQPSASRLVATLEREVGASLLTRTTRAVTLTEAGAEYLARVEGNPRRVGRGGPHRAGYRGAPRRLARRGFVAVYASRDHPTPRRVSLTTSRSANRACARVTRDRTLSPTPSTSRSASDTWRGPPPSHDGSESPTGSWWHLPRTFAAGTPKTPSDLAAHALIVGPASLGAEGWAFRKDGNTSSVRVIGRVTVTAIEAATAAAVAGLGIVSMGHVGCREELESGALARVLPDWEMGHADVKAILTADVERSRRRARSSGFSRGSFETCPKRAASTRCGARPPTMARRPGSATVR